MKILNSAAYKFIHLTNLAELKDQLHTQCLQLKLKGTILLAEEGINLMLAGLSDAMNSFKQYLQQDERFKDLIFKDSYSDSQPFRRMLVKVKKEIISMGVSDIKPEQKAGPAISPKELKQWLDERREFVLLDTRNTYEIALGSFARAQHLNIKHFREFPKATQQFANEHKTKPVVMFCTGGIRCEKASLLLLEQGVEEVYQLEGGILNYFAECGDAHYQGNCFVFDERIAIDPALQETNL